MTVTYEKRNVAIGSGVAVLLLAALGIYYFFIKMELPSPDEAVNVIQEPVGLVGLKDKLDALGVTGIILVGKDKIRVITTDGTPIDLCGSGSETDKKLRPSCKLATTANLVNYVSATPQNQGYCSDGEIQQTCHKNNNKYPYKPSGGHHLCDGRCQ